MPGHPVLPLGRLSLGEVAISISPARFGTICAGVIVNLLSVVAAPQATLAQQVLLFEDFESATPDSPMPAVCAAGGGGSALAEACIGTESIDFFNRSIVTETAATVTVTGGTFEDPFDPGNNQSLIMYNPDAAAQMAATVASVFDDDPTQFRNGVIQFDAYLEMPQSDALRTFLGIRIGHGPEDRTQVRGAGAGFNDGHMLWNSLRLHEGGLSGTGNEIDRFDDQGNGVLFLDPMPPEEEFIVPDRPMRVRYEINGENDTWKVSIDNLLDPDDPVDIVWPDGTAEQPWVEFFNFETFQNEPGPGINMISFMSDASSRGRGATSAQSAYIDNLLIINNDLPPLNIGDYNEDGVVGAADYTVWRDGLGTTFTQADYDVWRANFGATVGSSSTVGKAAVPEPASALLFLLGAAFSLSGLRFSTRHQIRRVSKLVNA